MHRVSPELPIFLPAGVTPIFRIIKTKVLAQVEQLLR